MPEEGVVELAGIVGSTSASQVQIHFTPARLPETCQLAMPRSFGTVSVVTTVPVPSFGQPQVTIAMTPPRVETLASADTSMAHDVPEASMVHDVPDVTGQDVPGLPGYMQEAMTAAGTLHDDLTN